MRHTYMLLKCALPCVRSPANHGENSRRRCSSIRRKCDDGKGRDICHNVATIICRASTRVDVS
eukprot:5148630-Pyramimonas_sp.AAC.1